MPTTPLVDLPKSLRAGIVGGGFMAFVHARSIRVAGGSVVGIASSSATRAKEAALKLDVSRAFDSVADLMASPDIDVVHVCTPNSTHAEFVDLAIASGKHVVCEKPLTTSVPESARLAEAARHAGIVATVPFVYRFHPMVREMRSRLGADGGSGIYTITGAYLQDWMSRPTDTDWRVESSRGGPSRAFGDIGSHLVDLIEFVAQDQVVRLHSTMRTVFPTRAGTEVDTEDLGVVLIEMAGGAIGTLTVSQVAQGRKNSLTLEISSSRESLRFDQENPEQLWVGRRAGSELLVRDPGQNSAETVRLSVAPAGHPLGYLDAFAAFVADTYSAVRGEAPIGLPTFDDGARSAIVIDAIVESARSQTPIDIASHTLTNRN